MANFDDTLEGLLKLRQRIENIMVEYDLLGDEIPDNILSDYTQTCVRIDMMNMDNRMNDIVGELVDC